MKELKENVEIILPLNGLEEKLKQVQKEKRKLVIKLGFDPTAPDLHLGHAVVLKKLKQFQDLGHQIVVVVGSFTARIGDPTGKNKSRKPLSAEVVKQNAETYIAQLSKVLKISQTKIVFNSEWLDNLPLSDIIQLLSRVTVAQLMQRNDFNKRFNENTPIAMHELTYPILQGYDSVMIECDIEMGGTDQLFNCTMGRQLQDAYGISPQIVMCMPILRGLDGKEKMSKSLNNTIGLTDKPNEMFGKTMSIPDSLITEYIDLTTDFTDTEKEKLKESMDSGVNPMNIKKIIAKNIISQYHSVSEAEKAEQFFVNQFQQQNFENKSFVLVDIKQFMNSSFSLLGLCCKLKSDLSRTSIRRLILQGGVLVNGEKVLNPLEEIILEGSIKIKIGKRSFYELK
ncbi:tyrosine--tRNA ligase [Fulvivirga kasyanovii]|uniref:Tyrosine--tRNA ligase n=1 Tax=Fulvivirga kasyanovii TaxID=396812 RepID=A0ABW9RJE0_9BACT|nr:tyrosine--tRNA ligase [Fulvivirga kasyanovii]MTI23801.1 tyrosine--tRNA ligase [Fulvivirga kasyanovii]